MMTSECTPTATRTARLIARGTPKDLVLHTRAVHELRAMT
jgi:hypothetical protein